MNKYHNKSKGRQVLATQQMLNAPHPEPVATAMLTHDDIAKHAHEIYVKKVTNKAKVNRTGCKPNRN